MKAISCCGILVGVSILAGCLPVPVDAIQKAVASKKDSPPGEVAGVTTVPGVEVVSTHPTHSAPVQPAPQASTSQSGRLWVVVRNLKVTRGFGLESEVSADWQVVRGS